MSDKHCAIVYMLLTCFLLRFCLHLLEASLLRSRMRRYLSAEISSSVMPDTEESLQLTRSLSEAEVVEVLLSLRILGNFTVISRGELSTGRPLFLKTVGIQINIYPHFFHKTSSQEKRIHHPLHKLTCSVWILRGADAELSPRL